MKIKLLISAAMISGLALGGCATISEDECAAGNWTDIGYRDGNNGADRTKLSSIVETCGEYGQSVDRTAYLQGFERGLDNYCVPARFYEMGLSGSSFNLTCGARDDGSLRAAYDEGALDYKIEADHRRYQEEVERLQDSIDDVRRRINDPETSDEERDRLRKKRERLEDELDRAYYDLRRHEREYDLY